MLAPLVVWWLGGSTPRADELRLLDAWAAERGARASLTPNRPEPPYDAQAVEQIEAALESARAAAEGAGDELARAERLLLAHPELPQAAWLLAEREALAAHGEIDGAAGPTALERALALEGARAPAAGGPPLPAAGSALPSAPVATLQTARLAIPPARPDDVLVVDGVPGSEGPLAPGRHHVRLLRGGRLVWAGWPRAMLGDAGPHPADPTGACSGLDFAGARPGPDGPHVEPGVLCAHWVAARPNALGGLDVSRCNGSSCTPWQHLGVRPDPELPVAETTGWPSWLTWTLVGAGVAATTSVVLWQTGAFEHSAPTTQFVFTGPSVAAHRF